MDEIVVYTAPILIGEGRGMWSVGPYKRLAEAERWAYRSVSRLGEDLCFDLRNQRKD